MMTPTARHSRSVLTPAGGFFSLPAMFAGAPDGVHEAFKMEIVPVPSVTRAGGEKPTEAFGAACHSDRALVDLGAVDPAALDFARLERDCEILTRALRDQPDVLRQALATVCGTGRDSIKITSSASAVAGIGSTEKGTRDQGGGFVVLAAVVVAILVLEGCTTVGVPIAPEPQVPVSPGPVDAGPG